MLVHDKLDIDNFFWRVCYRNSLLSLHGYQHLFLTALVEQFILLYFLSLCLIDAMHHQL